MKTELDNTRGPGLSVSLSDTGTLYTHKSAPVITEPDIDWDAVSYRPLKNEELPQSLKDFWVGDQLARGLLGSSSRS